MDTITYECPVFLDKILWHLSLLEDEYKALITRIAVIGSRLTGEYKKDSDLDIAIEYLGLEKEDVVFNLLNMEPLIIGGIVIHFFPCSIEEGHCIEDCGNFSAIDMTK